MSEAKKTPDLKKSQTRLKSGIKSASAKKPRKQDKAKKEKELQKRKKASYLIIPKGKKLRNKVIARLENENYHYTIARAIDLAKKYQRLASIEDPELKPRIKHDEQMWRDEQISSDEEARLEEARIKRLEIREGKRRKRAEMWEKEELHRRKYRLHPDDPNFRYMEGYEKRRHRITKKRFMKCVDVPLFREVLERSKDLRESPIWNEDLNLKNLSFSEVRKLKEHIQQFEVIVEALKQGIFDKPECDDIPVHKLRRKRNRVSKPMGKRSYHYSKFAPDVHVLRKDGEMHSRSHIHKNLKRRLSFPPYLPEGYDENEEVQVPKDPNWLTKVKSWLQATTATKTESVLATPPPKTDKPSQQSLTPMKTSAKALPQKPKKAKSLQNFSAVVNKVLEDPFRDRRRSIRSLGSGSHRNSEPELDNPRKQNPYSDYLTIKVPLDLAQRKKFVHSLVERRAKRTGLKDKAQVTHEKHLEAQKKYEMWFENKNEPLQMLHPDEKDSDIWTITTTTTTDSYASWRRLPDLTNMSKKMENLASPIDNTLAWRLLLLLFVIWEIAFFVKRRLNDVYYNIFSFYLYRENLWHFDPEIFAPAGSKYLKTQEYVHLFISIISLSILHRKNECVSLLFASSLMADGTFRAALSVYDSLYLPKPLSWGGVALVGLHLIWKSFSICLFVAYHYYSAGYIRKAREFKHRKTTLHNHEINVKGTKGLLKRQLAWNWMTSHARKTNLRRLKKKYPKCKDGNFPRDNLRDEIKFIEAKELRLYAQKHNMNIGYPYNKLRDMKRYVFGELEKSDYTEEDEDEELLIQKKRMTEFNRRSSRAITSSMWRQWKENERRQQALLLRKQKNQPKTSIKPVRLSLRRKNSAKSVETVQSSSKRSR